MADAVKQARSRPKVTFLRDDPADVDFFNTHTRLAEAIADAIRDTPDLKVIGLLGRWGSGKSTVAKKIVGLLEEDPVETDSKDPDAEKPKTAFRVFTYDAWLHQSDPIRRSFLESLLHFLVSQGAVRKGHWRPKLKELSGQVEDTQTIEVPELGPDARWLGLSLLPVPIGVGLLGLDTIKEAFGKDATPLGGWTLVAAIGLIFLPLLVWAARYLLRRPWRSARLCGDASIFKRRFWAIVDADGTPEAALRLFINPGDSGGAKSTRTFRSGNPTSLEFGQVFRDIMQEAAIGDHRLVILIDNLDRVAASEAVQMWATIRSFFLVSHETEEGQHEPYHPTVILPIDRFAIEQLFDAPANGTAQGNGDAPDRAGSFIDKTFDVTFEVTEPVTSDWRDFLDHQMAKIFGDAYQPQWGFWTRRLLEQSLPTSKTVVTPREINKLLNRIAALYVQRDPGDVSVEVMAFYLIKRDKIEGRRLLDYLQAAQTDLEDVEPDWRRQFAALHYGVPTGKAAQVLLQRPIDDAIVQFDTAAFEKLAAIPGFGEIFEFATGNLPDPDPQAPVSGYFMVLTNAALLLRDLPDEDAIWQQRSWNNLVSRYLRAEPIAEATADLPERLHAIAAHVPQDRMATYVDLTTRMLTEFISGVSKKWEFNAAGRRAGAQLVELARRHGLEAPEFYLRLDAKSYVSKLSSLSYSHVMWPQVRSEHEGPALTEAMIEMLRTPTEQASVPNAVRCFIAPAGTDLYNSGQEIDWDAVANIAGDVVRSPEAHNVSAFPGLRVLAELADRETRGRDLLVEIIDNGSLNARIREAFDAKDWADLASTVTLLLWRRGTFTVPDGCRWSQFINLYPKFGKAICDDIDRYFAGRKVEILWGSHAKNFGETRELIEVVIGKLVETGSLGPFDAKGVIDNLVTYKWAVPRQQRDQFLDLVSKEADLLSGLENTPLGPQMGEVVAFLQRRDGDDGEKAEEIVRQRIEAADGEAWRGAVITGNEPYAMALKFLRDGDAGLGKKSALFAALERLIPFMAKGATTEMRKRWFELAHLIKPRSEKELLQKLGKALATAKPAQALNVLKSGGQAFLKTGGFHADPGTSLKSIVLPQLDRKEGRSWLKDNDDEVQSWLKRADASDRSVVREALKKMGRSKLADRRYEADLLLNQWGMAND